MEKATFDKDIFYAYLVNGQLNNAIAYLSEYKQQAELYGKYIELFANERYISYDIGDYLNGILLIYQKYYREVFYLAQSDSLAEKNLKERLTDFFNLNNQEITLSDIENLYVKKAFNDRKYKFLGGKTCGHFGPYIWKTTQKQVYNVELPTGIRQYAVKLLDGFVTKSWLDYISFGAVSTGGWCDGEEVINCVRSCYDLQDESFTVSLLKHEAQHANDLEKYPDMSSEDLEYRAKLVELIYSQKRNLLHQFALEAGTSKADNGHAIAANRIMQDFSVNGSKTVTDLTTEEIQSLAKELFMKSESEVSHKYSK